MSDAPPVEARGLVKRYGEIVAVDHVDLHGRARRRLRLPRPERRRQDDLAADAARPDPADRGLGASCSAATRSSTARRRSTASPASSRGRASTRTCSGRTNLRAARRLRRAALALADRRGARARRAARPRARTGSAATRTGCGSGSASPRRSCASRGCCCSTSRRPASTRPACATCATSSAGSPARGSRSCSRATCSTRSRSSATASRSSARARSSTRARSRDLLATAASGYRLRARRARAGARRRCSHQPGVERRRARRRRASLHRRRGRRRRADGRARPGADRVHRARARDGEPRGAVPRHDRRRVVRPRPAPRRSPYDRASPASTAGSSRSCSRRSAPTSASAPRCSSRSSSSSCSCSRRGGPNDVPLGRYIRDTGLAAPFVVLFFMSIWGLPLITALVAGDIVASESHNGTLKTILTRSRERGEVFAGKVLATVTYTLAVVVRDGRRRPRRRHASPGASTRSPRCPGTKVSAGARARPAAREPRRSTRSPLAGIAAFGLLLSTVTRNSAASVVGDADVRAPDAAARRAARAPRAIRPYLLGNAVRRLARLPARPGRLGAGRSARSGCARSTSALPLVAAYLVFLRRDVAGD